MCARPEDHRFVECPQCEGEGVLYLGSPNGGWSEQCPECKGEGSVLEALPLIDEDDLDEWIGENLAEIDRQLDDLFPLTREDR